MMHHGHGYGQFGSPASPVHPALAPPQSISRSPLHMGGMGSPVRGMAGHTSPVPKKLAPADGGMSVIAKSSNKDIDKAWDVYGQKKPEKALKMLQKSLPEEGKVEAKACFLYGLLYESLDIHHNWNIVAGWYRRAVTQEPKDSQFVSWFMRALRFLGQYEEAYEASQKLFHVTKSINIQHEHDIGVRLQQLVLAFLLHDVPAMEYLVNTYLSVAHLVKDPVYNTYLTFANVIRLLLKHHGIPPVSPLVLAAKPVVYVLGESHILPLAWRLFSAPPSGFVLQPLLAQGLKAFHWSPLGDKARSYAPSCMRAHAALIPAGATVIIVCGEIDCRDNEGILPALKKGYHKDIESACRKTCEEYIDGVIRILASRGVTCLIHPVRSPFKSMPADVKEVCWSFNRNLQAEIERANHPHVVYLDVLPAMSTKSGHLKKKYQLDDTHITPGYALTGLFEKLVTPYVVPAQTVVIGNDVSASVSPAPSPEKRASVAEEHPAVLVEVTTLDIENNARAHPSGRVSASHSIHSMHSQASYHSGASYSKARSPSIEHIEGSPVPPAAAPAPRTTQPPHPRVAHSHGDRASFNSAPAATTEPGGMYHHLHNNALYTVQSSDSNNEPLPKPASTATTDPVVPLARPLPSHHTAAAAAAVTAAPAAAAKKTKASSKTSTTKKTTAAAAAAATTAAGNVVRAPDHTSVPHDLHRASTNDYQQHSAFTAEQQHQFANTPPHMMGGPDAAAMRPGAFPQMQHSLYGPYVHGNGGGMPGGPGAGYPHPHQPMYQRGGGNPYQQHQHHHHRHASGGGGGYGGHHGGHYRY